MCMQSITVSTRFNSHCSGHLNCSGTHTSCGLTHVIVVYVVPSTRHMNKCGLNMILTHGRGQPEMYFFESKNICPYDSNQHWKIKLFEILMAQNTVDTFSIPKPSNLWPKVFWQKYRRPSKNIKIPEIRTFDTKFQFREKNVLSGMARGR